jgi:hypothetical protein
MVSPVTSPVQSTIVRGLAALSVPPLSLPPAQPPDVAPAHNPQGPALAQGRGLQQQLTLQAQKNAALSDARAWHAQVHIQDPEALFSKKLRDDYRQVFEKIEASIIRGDKTLALAHASISHLPETVLRHFNSYHFAYLTRLSGLRIPAPASHAEVQDAGRSVHVRSCDRLSELSVAEAQKSRFRVVVEGWSFRKEQPGTQDSFSICSVECSSLKKIDLSDTAATALDLRVEQSSVCVVPPPKLLTWHGQVGHDFDRQGEIFLRILNNQVLQLDPETSPVYASPNDGMLIPAGLVKLAKVSLLMIALNAEIAAEARRSGVSTPCLQQACLRDLFGPVLGKYLGESTWLSWQDAMFSLDRLNPNDGFISGHDIAMIKPSLSLIAKFKAKECGLMSPSKLWLVTDWLPLQAYIEDCPALTAKPGDLAKICIRGVIYGLQKTDASDENLALDDASLANARVCARMQEPLLPNEEVLR